MDKARQAPRQVDDLGSAVDITSAQVYQSKSRIKQRMWITEESLSIELPAQPPTIWPFLTIANIYFINR